MVLEYLSTSPTVTQFPDTSAAGHERSDWNELEVGTAQRMLWMMCPTANQLAIFDIGQTWNMLNIAEDGC
jgi:hypothetical protein